MLHHRPCFAAGDAVSTSGVDDTPCDGRTFATALTGLYCVPPTGSTNVGLGRTYLPGAAVFR